MGCCLPQRSSKSTSPSIIDPKIVAFFIDRIVVPSPTNQTLESTVGTQNKSDDTRHPRSIFSLFFDGVVKNVHDKLHEDDDDEEKQAEKTKSTDKVRKNNDIFWRDESSNDDQSLVIRNGCEIQFVTVESVHYTEVNP